MTYQYSSPPDTTDDRLNLLADSHRRNVLSYFQTAPADVASVRELAADVSTQDDRGEEQMALRLHHATLPRLEEAGLVDYDTRSKTVRYHGHSEVAALLECIEDY